MKNMVHYHSSNEFTGARLYMSVSVWAIYEFCKAFNYDMFANTQCVNGVYYLHLY